MNRIEVTRFLESFFASLSKAGAIRRETDLKPFFKLITSLKREIPLSLLREISALGAGQSAEREEGIIKKRIDRIYLRMCRIQEELGRLDFKKAAPGESAESFIFSQIDFSRYREMEAAYFETLFLDGLEDFDEVFFEESFGLDRKGVKSLIEECYKKNNGLYKIQKENPLILSVMRNLEMSLGSSPLFTAEEIGDDLKSLFSFLNENKGGRKLFPGTEKLYPLLVMSLDGAVFTHNDGMVTKLFVSEQGNLSGTFRPADKPWTRVLIKQEAF